MNSKKGFILSTYVYILLTFFLLILGTTLIVLNNTKMLAKKIKEESFEKSGLNAEFSFILKGNKAIELYEGDTFTDPGYIAQTTKGEKLEATINSNVDTSKAGDYVVIYTITYNGNIKSLTRNVKVLNGVIEFAFTGSFQEFTVPTTGWYTVELWGAQGAGTVSLGTYTSGQILMNKGEKYYIYVGEGLHTPINQKSFNGGTANGGGNNGGGATDIRWFENDPSNSDLIWDSSLGIKSRIMVAGGSGSGYGNNTALLGMGGGLIGNAGGGTNGGTQTAFGAVQSSLFTASSFGIANGGCSGGNGYYPGGGAGCADGAGGGSSFISGYAGVNAINSNGLHTNDTIHYSTKYFIDGKMESGVNSGNGKAKITLISGQEPERINTAFNNIRYIKDCINGSSSNIDNHWVEIQAIYHGRNIAKGKIGKLYNSSNVEITTSLSPDTSFDNVTDGNISNITPYAGYFSGSTYEGLQCFIIDLGLDDNQEPYDLDEVAVWHYWMEERTYNDNITYTSSDKVNWTPIINNQIAETSQGKRVTAYE